MKRMLAMVLVLTMALGLGAVPALAAGDAAAPAADVTYSFSETVLVDNEDIKVTATAFDLNHDYGPAFSMLFENRTDRDLRFGVMETYLDGRRCDGPCTGEMAAGQQTDATLFWYRDDMAENGVNYINDVKAVIWVYSDEDDIETVYKDTVCWSTNAASDTPVLTDVTFDSGFEEIPILSGDYTAVIKDFDPDGLRDEGEPTFVLYLENNTEAEVRFFAENVSINGTKCDPGWLEIMAAETSIYNTYFYWTEKRLEEAGIESIENVEFDLVVRSPGTSVELENVPVSVDLTGSGTAAAALAEEPVEAPAEEAAEETEGKFAREYLAEPLVTADPITLSTGGQSVTISLPTECALYSGFSQSSNVEAEMAHVSDYGSGCTYLELENESDPAGYVANETKFRNNTLQIMKAENVQATEAVTEQINGMDVTWAKVSGETTNVFGTRVQMLYYFAAVKVGPFLLTAEVEHTGQAGSAAIDDSIVAAIFDHVALNGGASAEPSAGEESGEDMMPLGSGGGALMAMTGFENPEGYNAVMHVHMENETDAAVDFDVVDVTVNGVAYDPIWEATLAPGASEDSDVEWEADFLILAASYTDDPNVKSMAAAIATIERFETLTMTVQATVPATGEELFSQTVTLDVTQNG